MTAFNAASTEAYRSSTKDQLWLDHRRKHCACGKVITEKQLRQYGSCSACYTIKESATNGKSRSLDQGSSDLAQGA